VATVDLGQVESIQSIELNALQDIKPWIWSPESVVFSASVDGETFEVLERVESQLSERDEEVQVETFSCSETIDARFVRVETTSRGMIPEWHLGNGNPRWTFLDEIVVEIAD
jgi:predicted Zn-dependent peptidase